MEYNLFEFLSGIADPRRSQGQRYSLDSVLAIVIMAIMSGETGLRGFARFAASNKTELIETFNFKHGVPTFGTFRSILLGINSIELAQKFKIWMSQYNFLDKSFSLDGKVLRSTVTHPNDSMHDFVNVVSVFGHQTGLVHAFDASHIKDKREAEAVRDLLNTLGINIKNSGATFTMDAAHSQKKHLLSSVP